MLKGVRSVVPGYTGGKISSDGGAPSYDEVSTGRTGHAEAIKIEYDPAVISYDDLLAVFFNTHDPTTLNRQGNDIGTQYRSAIFYGDEEQHQKAVALVNELNLSRAYEKDVVTEVVPLDKFFEAEDYHHNYYKNNQGDAYCQIVIAPKLDKLQKRFSNLVIPANAGI